jgi:glycosyltransferase involved in cell wall biosynthesis
MKVLQIITHFAVGGATYTALMFAGGIKKKGHQVDIVSGVDPVMDIEGDLLQKASYLDINVISIKQLKRSISPFRDLIAFVKLLILIQKGNYDIVHTHSSKAGILGRIAAKIAGVKVVHNVHGWPFHDRMDPFIRYLYIAIERFMARITDTLIVVTKEDKLKGLEKGIGSAAKYSLIRSGIDLKDFSLELFSKQQERTKLGIKKDALVVGTVGRLSPQKAPLDFVKLAQKLLREKDIVFLMAGDGVMRKEVEAYIKENNLGAHIKLIGKVEDVRSVLACVDVFVLPSLWEGLPRVIPEAMAMGVPVIATAINGVKEIVLHKQNGFLVEPHDIEEMKKYCLKLLTDKESRNLIVNNARQTVQEYSSEKMLLDLEELYVSLYNN